MNIIFKTASQEDIAELTRIRLEYLSETFDGISEEEHHRLSAQLPEYFERSLGNECFAFIAKDGAKIVSAAVLVLSKRPMSLALRNGLVGEVMSVYTETEYRNKGLCTQLMKNMIAYAKEIGVDRIDLTATNEGYPVYKNVGFTERNTGYIEMRLTL